MWHYDIVQKTFYICETIFIYVMSVIVIYSVLATLIGFGMQGDVVAVGKIAFEPWTVKAQTKGLKSSRERCQETECASDITHTKEIAPENISDQESRDRECNKPMRSHRMLHMLCVMLLCIYTWGGSASTACCKNLQEALLSPIIQKTDPVNHPTANHAWEHKHHFSQPMPPCNQPSTVMTLYPCSGRGQHHDRASRQQEAPWGACNSIPFRGWRNGR